MVNLIGISLYLEAEKKIFEIIILKMGDTRFAFKLKLLRTQLLCQIPEVIGTLRIVDLELGGIICQMTKITPVIWQDKKYCAIIRNNAIAQNQGVSSYFEITKISN